MENFGQAMPVSAVPLLTALLQRFINFIVLKSMALSYTPYSEHILEIAMCSKNKQSLYEVFHLHKKDYIRDVHASWP